MSEQEIAEALNVFDQVHRGLDRSFSGPGVDYAVAKTFVELQNGRFLIKSRKGYGTLVRICLPIAVDNAGANPVAPTDETTDSKNQKNPVMDKGTSANAA